MLPALFVPAVRLMRVYNPDYHNYYEDQKDGQAQKPNFRSF